MVENTSTKALIIVDVQNDFCTGGSLAVGDNEMIFPIIDKLRASPYKETWKKVYRTRDWHPADHCSFQVNNPGSELFKPFKLANGVDQVMWPVHCVQNTKGAEWHEKCPLLDGEVIVDKGTDKTVDSYSGFGTAPEKTILLDELKKEGITEIYCVGLAYDYCVGSTAEDGAKNGFKTYLVTDATKAVNPATAEPMKQRLADAGVIPITSEEVPKA